MYTATDLKIIHNAYFSLLEFASDHVELLSNNTKHCWLIVQKQNYFLLYHKHHLYEEYHLHASTTSIQDCFLNIVDHDEFQLRGRKPARRPVINSFFDTIINEYQ